MSEKELLEQLEKMGEQINVPDSLAPEKVNERLNKKRNKKRWFYGSASTLVAAAAVILLIIGLPGKVSTPSGMGKTESYDQLYSIFNTQKEKNSYMEIEDAEMAKGSTATEDTNSTAPVTSGTTEHSSTNVQVEGVDEADVIKNDGKYIYMIPADSPKSVDIYEGTRKVVRLDTGISNIEMLREIYVKDNYLVVMGDSYRSKKETTTIAGYDISNPENPEHVYTHYQSGRYKNSRMVGGYVYLFSQYNVSMGYTFKKKNPVTYVPSIDDKLCETRNIDAMGVKEADGYMVVSSFCVTKGEQLSSYHAYVTSSDTLYASEKYFYMTEQRSWDDEYQGKTDLIRFRYEDGQISKEGTGTVEGTFNNQFSLDEKDGYLRVVVTNSGHGKMSNSLYVLDRDMKVCGSIEDLAPGERIYSARFLGNLGYFVTYRETDPLFSVDLSDPRDPKLLGALKIPGFSEYLHFWGDHMLLGIGQEETRNGRQVKLSMFDITDPTNVREIGKKLMPITYYGTEVSDTHKAAFVDYEKNLIGFPLEAQGDNSTLLSYCVMSWEKNAFQMKKMWEVEKDRNYYNSDTRGLFMGDRFYVASTIGKVLSTPLSDLTKK